jgi:hypothetical protein
MKAPPPFAQATPGKRRKFPRPTALPVTARITPSFDPHFSLAMHKPLDLRHIPSKNLEEQGTVAKEEDVSF